jgi:chromosome segregation ATPase
MVEDPKNQVSHDLASGLQNLGETTTAAELVRRAGQTKRVKVISERKLMEWILSLLKQHMAGKEDAFSDEEKSELLRKTQKELEKRILREQAAEAERARVQAELQAAMANLSNKELSEGDYQQALDALRAKLDSAEQTNQDLQQDNFEIQDQLQEKMAMLSTTLAEKDRLRDTVRQQMVHSGDLIGGVLGIDNQFYGGRHQEENPVPEDAGQDEQFYHDFSTGAKVITTLSSDLERLRGIAKTGEMRAVPSETPAGDDSGAHGLLASDLKLLEELKAGNLHAVDVAMPVAGLVEALEGGRHEAENLEATVAAFTHNNSQQAVFTSLPDPNGPPAEVIAGATVVARELASELARSRQRLTALKQIADEAEQERGVVEGELEQLRAAYNRVLGALQTRANDDQIEVPAVFADAEAQPESRTNAAIEVISKLHAGPGPEANLALAEHLEVVTRLVGNQNADSFTGDHADHDAVLSKLSSSSTALENLVAEQRKQLADAAMREGESAAREQAEKARLEAVIAERDRALQHIAQNVAKTMVAAGADQATQDAGADLAMAAEGEQPETLVNHLTSALTVLSQRVDQLSHHEHSASTAAAEAANVRSELARVHGDHLSAQMRLREHAASVARIAASDSHLADAANSLQQKAADAGTHDGELQDQLHALTMQLAIRRQELADEASRLARAAREGQTAEAELAILRSDLERARDAVRGRREHERTLAGELLRAAQGDERLASRHGDLVHALDSADDMHRQILGTVAALGARKHELTSERDRLAAELAQARAELARHTSDRDRDTDADRALATSLIDAARGDDQLADTTADVALAMDAAGAHEPLPTDVRATARVSIENLAARKRQLETEVTSLRAELAQTMAKLAESAEAVQALEREHQETAESGREIITQLRQQKDARDKELQALKAENDAAALKLDEFSARLLQSEAANRTLAEALHGLAAAASRHDVAGAPAIEDPRMELEVALSHLPGEDEADVVAPHDISRQLAQGGRAVAEALIARTHATGEALARASSSLQARAMELDSARADAARNRAAIEERDSSLRRNQAELTALRRELTDQGAALAARIQELTNARSELAGGKADLAVAQERVELQDVRLAELQRQNEQAVRDLALLRANHETAQAKIHSHEQSHQQLVTALRTLGGMGHGLANPVTKAAQKLELAQAVGGDELIASSKTLVDSVRAHAQHLDSSLADARARLEAGKEEQQRLEAELSKERGALADREHTISNLQAEVAKTDDHSRNLDAQLTARAREIETLTAAQHDLAEKLRHAEAELEDLRARGSASAGHLHDEMERLREEAAAALTARKAAEAQQHDLKELVDAGDARLKRQREEFTRRLEERDRLIKEKDQQIDEHGQQRVDAKGLDSQIQTLSSQLATAHQRIKEMESVYGEHAGSTTKSLDLARELKKAHAERDAIREQKRQLEGELADAVSASDELRHQLDEKRKDTLSARDGMAKELAEERQKTSMLREEFRKLKEEVIGLRARLKRLTEAH